jgi:hypothetical protein
MRRASSINEVSKDCRIENWTSEKEVESEEEEDWLAYIHRASRDMQDSKKRSPRAQTGFACAQSR